MKQTENTSRKGSLLDLFLILLIVGCLVTAGLRYHDLQPTTDEGELRTYLVLATAKNLRGETVSCIREGDVVYTVSGDAYGTLYRVSSAPARIRLWENGDCYEGEWPDGTVYDLTVEMTVMGRDRNGVLLRQGVNAILCGQSLVLYTAIAELSLTVESYAPVLTESPGG